MNMMPPITKNLLIINVLCYFASLAFASHGVDFDELFGLHFFLASHFQPWQFFTYMFMHANLQHLFFNMFAVWMFGRIMEQTMGQKRFLFYYLTCGLGAGLTQELVQLAEYWYYGFGNYEQVALGSGIVAMDEYLNRWNTVGASGAVYGILLSFGMTFPEERMFIFPLPVPIKAKYFVMGYAVIELLSAMSLKGDGVAHMAHLGGMLVVPLQEERAAHRRHLRRTLRTGSRLPPAEERTGGGTQPHPRQSEEERLRRPHPRGETPSLRHHTKITTLKSLKPLRSLKPT